MTADGLLHPGPAASDRRLLGLLAVSALAHAALLAALPQVAAPEPEPPRVLEASFMVVSPPAVERQAAARPPLRHVYRPRAIRHERSPTRPRIEQQASKPVPPLPAPVITAPSALAEMPSSAPTAPSTSLPDPAPGPRVALVPGSASAVVKQAGPAAPAIMPPSFDAAYLDNPTPRYPLISRRNGEEGTVTLRVLVTRNGNAGKVVLEHTSGSPALDEAALGTVKRWRFVPARRDGQAVDASVLVPVVFRLQDAS